MQVNRKGRQVIQLPLQSELQVEHLTCGYNSEWKWQTDDVRKGFGYGHGDWVLRLSLLQAKENLHAV